MQARETVYTKDSPKLEVLGICDSDWSSNWEGR